MVESTTLADLLEALASAGRAHSRLAAAEVVSGIEHYARTGAASIDVELATSALKRLVDNRWFDLAERLADLWFERGVVSPRLRRLSCQAWIDRGRYHRALPELERLIGDRSAPESERLDARGLKGRVHKQVFVDTLRVESYRDDARLTRAIACYVEAFETQPALATYQGINAVALLRRAERDGVRVTHDAGALARRILELLQAKPSLEIWDRATKAEAHLALGEFDPATEALRGYVDSDAITAFQLGSTLRQLKEIWQVDARADDLIQMLQARLLEIERGSLSLSAADIAVARMRLDDRDLERVFNNARFMSIPNYKKGLERAACVARIGRDSATGVGTGFLLRAKQLAAC